MSVIHSRVMLALMRQFYLMDINMVQTQTGLYIKH